MLILMWRRQGFFFMRKCIDGDVVVVFGSGGGVDSRKNGDDGVGNGDGDGADCQ